MSVASPPKTFASMQRRTWPTMNSLTSDPARLLDRTRVEVGERSREHHLGQHRVVADEGSEDTDEGDEIGARVV